MQNAIPKLPYAFAPTPRADAAHATWEKRLLEVARQLRIDLSVPENFRKVDDIVRGR